MEKPRGEIVIYEPVEGEARVEVRLEHETVWLDAHQMADLFQRDRTVILKHIRNIYTTGELSQESTCAKFAQVAKDGKTRLMDLYDLDVIIGVGYRVNSRRGTDFRIWATNILRDHITKGYTINQRRLVEQAEHYRELQNAIRLIGDVITQQALDPPQAEGLLRVITDYTYALSVLDDYDHQQLTIRNTTHKEPFRISYEAARKAVDAMADRMRQDGKEPGLFGREKDESFKSSLAAIYQTFGGEDLYPSIEEKAAHLLYFITKNHSFSDGNKRIAAAIFLWFLDANGLLYTESGQKRLGDNALVALTLMIAESKPQHKDVITKIIVNLINRDNP
ncbi:MAG: virulence protein RhuM/Fic/DOC family protein [Armatimonadota bacterium]